ncbi:transmembrane protein 186 [Octopus bimaculoides]|uniref:Transmembrane protein 186 n=1 Tax=Octopus bimaculoides TaxID=37653 RepID=A0A0L8GYM5_OCTBM|nr:transmembrane protein 186 [Octopus bimaculoides]XP_014777238.1 transmembrane protein 186 [Octopus bimaculoides]XP_014777239.1 transmembrane protein 186 [Octopus bimaculoides]XP_014777240.1 transmembrane protein 186 [Octopus bimaculoides]XP_052825126.1 transmembrane protein 186 [Octopus bimaculoides]XP_052825127.1 transmembrane protein 186 [Octopus bimaculoides]|eukprot:XP_014777237.1 PREDICTED: transmembrane protein 186-like [Octopus bimaculoides]
MLGYFSRRTMSTVISKINFPRLQSHSRCPFSALLSQNFQHHFFQCQTFSGTPYILNKLLHKPLNSQMKKPSPSPSPCCGYSNEAGLLNRNFEVIYRFPYIVHMHLLSRFKIYQTAFSVAAVPLCYAMHSNGQLSLALCHYVVIYSIVACAMLYAFSFYLWRLVGIIAYNSVEDLVKVSHLTFWGGRKDIFLHVKSIIPLSDMSDNPNDIFVKFQQYDNEEVLFLVLKFGGIKDMEKFQLVLGDIK